MVTDTINYDALKRVHGILKHETGALRSIFASACPKILAPNVKDATEDISRQFNLNEQEYTALMYLLSLSTTKGTENVDYFNFINILRRPCPRPPSSGAPFLPYLSFLCKPNKSYSLMKDVPIDGVKTQSNASSNLNFISIVPPHPSYVAKPKPSYRESFYELKAALSEVGPNVSFQKFWDVLNTIDGSITKVECLQIFCETAKHLTVRCNERTALPADALAEHTQPHLMLYRQRTRDSERVRESMNWTPGRLNNKEPYISPAFLRSSSGSLSSSSSKKNTPRLEAPYGYTPECSYKRRDSGSTASPGAVSDYRSISPRGGKMTKSADLRRTIAVEQQNDPSCPAYKGEYYNYVPAVPESHYRKNAENDLKSRYSPRSLHTPRTLHSSEKNN